MKTEHHFDLQTGHVAPALMPKAHQAKVIGAPAMPVWGTGNAKREFLHVDDLADAVVQGSRAGLENRVVVYHSAINRHHSA